jgi:hypothetical protein
MVLISKLDRGCSDNYLGHAHSTALRNNLIEGDDFNILGTGWITRGGKPLYL